MYTTTKRPQVTSIVSLIVKGCHLLDNVVKVHPHMNSFNDEHLLKVYLHGFISFLLLVTVSHFYREIQKQCKLLIFIYFLS